MVNHGRIECISHPLCENLIERKWNLYGLPYNLIVMSLYLIYLLALTIIVLIHPKCINEENDACPSNTSKIQNKTDNYLHVNIFK